MGQAQEVQDMAELSPQLLSGGVKCGAGHGRTSLGSLGCRSSV